MATNSLNAVKREFVLGVDIDGVCGDHTAAFRKVVADDLGVTPDSLGEQLSWDLTEWGLSSEDFDRLHRRAVLDYRIFRTMPVIDDCAQILWRLSDAGVWIRLITHRLWSNWGHALAVADTVAWLDEAGIPYRDLCFLGDKPQVEADAYLDDAPHNIEALRSSGAFAIVFDQPYNRSVPGPRVESWQMVEPAIFTLMSDRGFDVQCQLPLADDAVGRLHGRINRHNSTPMQSELPNGS